MCIHGPILDPLPLGNGIVGIMVEELNRVLVLSNIVKKNNNYVTVHN